MCAIDNTNNEITSTSNNMQNYSSDVEAVDALAKAYNDLSAEIGKIIVGQKEVVKMVLISLFGLSLIHI